jgi:ankyrin repeat protein
MSGAGAKFNPFRAVTQKNLFDAARTGDLATVDALLARGADPDMVDDAGATPLMYAINGDHGPVVRSLLYHGAEVNNEGPSGWSPIHFAVERKHHGILTDLLRVEEIDVNKRLPNGSTALHIAAQNNDPMAARLLLASGANVHVSNKGGNTAFMILAEAANNANISEMKQILQEAMVKPMYPKNRKHKTEGGRRKKMRRGLKMRRGRKTRR